MALPTIVAEAAWTTDPLATPTWTPIPKCRALKTTGNHRSAALGRFEAGVIDATFSNKDRSLEPLFPAGANYPNVRTRKRVRFRAVANGGAGATYPIAHGYIEKAVPTYPKQWKDAICTLTASDAFRLFAGIQLQSPYAAAVVADAPAAFYRFQEGSGATTAADSSGNGKNGTYSGTLTMGVASPVVEDAAKTFTDPSSGGGVETSVATPGTGPFWIAFWINGAPPAGIASQDFANNGARISYTSGGGGNLAFVVPGISAASISPSLGGGVWHFVVATWDGTTSKIYVDNILGGTTGTGSETTRSSVPWVLGIGSNIGASYGEFEIGNGGSLSAARVAARYTAATTGWAGDTSTARIGRVLDATGWPSGDRDLDAGVAVLTDAGNLSSQKALDHLRLVDATEGGCLTMSRDGKVMFRNRRSIQTGPARNTVSQATFGDQGGTEIGWTDLGLAFDDVELANRVTITRRNGIVAVALDQAQITASGTAQDRGQSSVSNSDLDATSQANWLLALLKNPNRWRFEKAVIPLTSSNQDAVLGREIWDRITVAFTPPGGGARISQDVLIVGIDHNVLPGGGHWDVTFHTTGTDLQLTPFILDTSVLDGTDVLVY